jgi:hypothetical protein
MMGERAYDSSLPFRASRVDENQSEIVSAFRKLGYTVSCLHGVGNGVFDLLIAKHGLMMSVEVKDGSQPFSRRQFTKPQRKWNFSWQGMRCVVKCLDEVEHVDRQFRILVAKIKAAGIELKIDGCQDAIYHPSFY